MVLCGHQFVTLQKIHYLVQESKSVWSVFCVVCDPLNSLSPETAASACWESPLIEATGGFLTPWDSRDQLFLKFAFPSKTIKWVFLYLWDILFYQSCIACGLAVVSLPFIFHFLFIYIFFLSQNHKKSSNCIRFSSLSTPTPPSTAGHTPSSSRSTLPVPQPSPGPRFFPRSPARLAHRRRAALARASRACRSGGPLAETWALSERSVAAICNGRSATALLCHWHSVSQTRVILCGSSNFLYGIDVPQDLFYSC